MKQAQQQALEKDRRAQAKRGKRQAIRKAKMAKSGKRGGERGSGVGASARVRGRVGRDDKGHTDSDDVDGDDVDDNDGHSDG